MNSQKLNFILREPANAYHAKSAQYLTAHALRDFRRCPLLYRKKQLGLVEDRDTTEYLIGRAAHVLILEGRERYEQEFAVGGPINPKTGQPFGSATKAFAEWAAAQSKPVLSDSQAAIIEQMWAAVGTHGSEMLLDRGGIAEGVVRCTYAEHACQARIDWISDDDAIGVVELKTTKNLDLFETAVRDLQYVHQLAFYRMLIRSISGYCPAAHIIAIEKTEPFRVGLWKIADPILVAAEWENIEAMNELLQCLASNVWPTRYEMLRTIDKL